MQMKLDKFKDSTCNKCIYLEINIVKLNHVIKKYEKCQVGLENVLSKKKYINDRSDIGYSKFDKPSSC